jgi:hypothetical protein
MGQGAIAMSSESGMLWAILILALVLLLGILYLADPRFHKATEGKRVRQIKGVASLAFALAGLVFAIAVLERHPFGFTA